MYSRKVHLMCKSCSVLIYGNINRAYSRNKAKSPLCVILSAVIFFRTTIQRDSKFVYKLYTYNLQ